MEIRGITIAVNYAHLLAVTLPRNMRHMAECVVVSSHEDVRTHEVCESTAGTRLLKSDAYRRHGAVFNKGLMMEEGLDFLGRHGWILIWDADIVFPDDLPLSNLDPRMLHGVRRRMLRDPGQWSPDLDWRRLPFIRDGGPIGFFQLFHADALAGKRPWYDVTFTHAGGGDAYFLTHFGQRRVLPIDVLHLGDNDRNWFGTDPTGQDMMARFVRENGWTRAVRKHSDEAAARSPEIVERVDVPGYAPTGFELPFVRRAKEIRERRGSP